MKKLLMMSLLTTFTALQANASGDEMIYRCSEDISHRDDFGYAVSIYREGNGNLKAYLEQLYTADTQCWPTDPGGHRPSPMDCEYEVLSSDIASFQTTFTNSPNELIFRNNAENFKLKMNKPISKNSIGTLNWNNSVVKVYCAKIK